MIPIPGLRGGRFPIPGSAVVALAAASLLAAPGAARAADPGRGGTLYASHCAICHGEQGRPVWPGTPDFRRPAALLKPDAVLLSAMRGGRGVMPAYQGVLKEREMQDVMAFLRTLGS